METIKMHFLNINFFNIIQQVKILKVINYSQWHLQSESESEDIAIKQGKLGEINCNQDCNSFNACACLQSLFDLYFYLTINSHWLQSQVWADNKVMIWRLSDINTTINTGTHQCRAAQWCDGIKSNKTLSWDWPPHSDWQFNMVNTWYLWAVTQQLTLW